MVSLASPQWEFEWAAGFERIAGFVLSFVRVGASFVEQWGWTLSPWPTDPSHGEAHPLNA